MPNRYPQPHPAVSRGSSMPARIVFMGAQRAGTSALLRRFNLGIYQEIYHPEIAKVRADSSLLIYYTVH